MDFGRSIYMFGVLAADIPMMRFAAAFSIVRNGDFPSGNTNKYSLE